MKIRVEIQDDLCEEEVIIRCQQMDERVARIERLIREESKSAFQLVFYKQDEQYYFPLDDILFFEAGDHGVYAHTTHDMFRVRSRLSALEEMLPRQFVRIAKATILNVRHVYSLQRSITALNLVQFYNSHKQVYISRKYLSALKQRLGERSSL